MELYGVTFNENSISEVLDIVSKHKACVKEDVFKKYFPKLYDELMSKPYPESFIFAQKLFHFLYEDNDLKKGLCKTCGKRTTFLGFSKGYRPYCNAKCMGADEEFWKKHMDASLEKYGCMYPSQSKEVKKKIKQTNLERYGHEYITQVENIKEKSRETKIERYGNPGYNNPQKISETWKEKEDLLDVIKAREETYRRKTGYANPFSNPEVIKKINEKNLMLYGYERASQNPEIKRKISDTRQSFTKEKNDEINSKRKETCQKLYQKDSVSQVDMFKIKAAETKHKNTIEKYPGIIEIKNTKFICQCADSSCDLCQEKQFEIYRPVYLYRLSHNEELCCIKNPVNYSSSKVEKEFGEFISSIYTGNIIFNDRSALEGKEIDIYLPDLKIGFEFNGIYFHSEFYKDKNYHQEKALLAIERGISLVQVWEDDWFSKREIIQDLIRSKIGLFDVRIGARNCQIKEIDSEMARYFIDSNHLQQYVNSSVKIGLFYNDELMSVVTFGKLRNFMRFKGEEREYELYRFCTKRGYQIIGGFQKMLNYFIKTYNPKRIITYASLDISTGEIYKNAGFKYVKTTSVGYYWVNESAENQNQFHCRKHRFNFKKSDLVKMGFDTNKSETEIMHENHYFKCFDSGNFLFELIP